MTDDQIIRAQATEIAKELAIAGYGAADAAAVIGEAKNIADFIADGTVPS